MSKHTPGPWVFEKSKYGSYWITGANGMSVGSLIGDGKSKLHPEEANAHLVAAAPEMLAMLKRLSKVSTMDSKLDEELLVLIDIAEGRS